MSIENLFVTASREKYRFDSKVGQLTTEDLWQLPLTSENKASLNGVAIELSRQLKGSEESFVATATAKDKTLTNKLEIVKYVIQVRMAENAAKLEEANRKETLSRIDALIQQKEDEKLSSKSLEELQALKASL